jgi:hypothetical protein
MTHDGATVDLVAGSCKERGKKIAAHLSTLRERLNRKADETLQALLEICEWQQEQILFLEGVDEIQQNWQNELHADVTALKAIHVAEKGGDWRDIVKPFRSFEGYIQAKQAWESGQPELDFLEPTCDAVTEDDLKHIVEQCDGDYSSARVTLATCLVRNVVEHMRVMDHNLNVWRRAYVKTTDGRLSYREDRMVWLERVAQQARRFVQTMRQTGLRHEEVDKLDMLLSEEPKYAAV